MNDITPLSCAFSSHYRAWHSWDVMVPDVYRDDGHSLSIDTLGPVDIEDGHLTIRVPGREYVIETQVVLESTYVYNDIHTYYFKCTKPLRVYP